MLTFNVFARALDLIFSNDTDEQKNKITKGKQLFKKIRNLYQYRLIYSALFLPIDTVKLLNVYLFDAKKSTAAICQKQIQKSF